MDLGGRRAKRAEENPGSSVQTRIHVNDIRSGPGNTRLSQDDGSIHKANSLK